MCMCGCARDMLCACVGVCDDVLCVYVCRVQGRVRSVLIFHSLPYSLLLMLFYSEINLTL